MARNCSWRGLRSSRTYTVGIIADDVSQIFTATILSGICDYLREFGYTSMIMHANSFGVPSSKEQDALENLTRRSVDGIIFADTSFKSSSDKALNLTDKPHVFVNRGQAPGARTIGTRRLLWSAACDPAPAQARLEAHFAPDLLDGVVVIEGTALRDERAPEDDANPYSTQAPHYKPVHLKAVLYFAWDNRDEGDILVWVREAAPDSAGAS